MEGDARWVVGLYDAGNNIHRWSLGCDYGVDADGTGKLGDTGERSFGFTLGGHHEVGKLVDDDNHKWHFVEFSGGLCFRVVAGDVTDLFVGENLVTIFHLLDDPLEKAYGVFGIADDGMDEVGNFAKESEFDSFRVDEHQFELFRGESVEQAQNEVAHADRLSTARGSSYKEVGGFGEVGDDYFSLDIHTHGNGDGFAALLPCT